MTQEASAVTTKSLDDQADEILKEYEKCREDADNILKYIAARTLVENELDDAEIAQANKDREARALAFKETEAAERARAQKQIGTVARTEKERAASAKDKMEMVEAAYAAAEASYSVRVKERKRKFEAAKARAEDLKQTAENMSEKYSALQGNDKKAKLS